MIASTIAYSAIPCPLQDDQSDFRDRAATFGTLCAHVWTMVAGTQRGRCFYKGFTRLQGFSTGLPYIRQLPDRRCSYRIESVTKIPNARMRESAAPVKAGSRLLCLQVF